MGPIWRVDLEAWLGIRGGFGIASAGHRARATSMATMYPTIKSLMQVVELTKCVVNLVNGRCTRLMAKERPSLGIEPMTFTLQDWRSTTER